MPKAAFNDLVEFGACFLAQLGFEDDLARFIAVTAATTEAAGIHTHGAVILTAIAGQVGTLIDVKAGPKVLRERGATALIDGHRCVSHAAMRLALDLAVAKAREHGIAMVGARNTSWLGGLGTFLIPIARQRLFAQLWAQSSQCQDSAPYGGVDARFSTNPVAFAFPTAGEPVIADFSTAVYSMGKVGTLAAQGKRAPEKVFFDKAGRLTDDPKAVRDGGAMLMMGQQLNGHKGYALAFWAEALTAMAGGSCNNPALEQRQCFNLTVVDPTAFEGMDYYLTEMKRFVAHVKSSRLMAGFDAIRLPGERMLAQIERSKRDGIEMPQALVHRLNDAAAKHGLEALRVMA